MKEEPNMNNKRIDQRALIREFITGRVLLEEEGDEEKDAADTKEKKGGEGENALDVFGNDSKEPDEKAGGTEEKNKQKEDNNGDVEDEEVEDISPADVELLSKSVDDDIMAVLIDYEADARRTAELSEARGKGGKYSIRKALLGEAASTIDVGAFATDVARLIKNYTNLLDMEAIIVKKSVQLLMRKYDKNVVEEFLETLNSKHDISFGEKEKISAPLAVGAISSGGGA